MNYYLKKVNLNIGKLEYDMYQEMPYEEPGATNEAFNTSFEEFKKYIVKLIEDENRILDNEGTPVITYIMYVDDFPVGDIGIRTKINEYYEKHSGNIFYKIRPSERNKGYGSKMLQLALEEARKLEFKEVKLQCKNKNMGSQKVIENNNGILIKEDDYSRYYKIIL